MEGFYPPSLEYLEEHYGLTYDKERYRIDYQPVGSNLMPDMAVLIVELFIRIFMRKILT